MLDYNVIRDYPLIQARLFAYDLKHKDLAMFNQVEVAKDYYPSPEFMSKIAINLPPDLLEFYLKYSDNIPAKFDGKQIYVKLNSNPIELWHHADNDYPIYTTFTPHQDIKVYVKDLDVVTQLMERGIYLNRYIDSQVLNVTSVK